MATSLQRSPLYNGHLSTMATSTQRAPLHNGHLYTTGTSPQRAPLHNGNLSTTATSLQRPPLYYDHLSTTGTSLLWPPLYNGHLSTMATSLQRPLLYYGHLSTTATSPQRAPLYYGHLSTMATSLLWPPLHNGHLSTTATSPQRAPLYYGHLSTMGTSLQRSPLSTSLATFFCSDGQSIQWLLFNPLCNGNVHYSTSPSAKITTRQQLAFSTTDKWSQEWSRNLISMAGWWSWQSLWLCSIQYYCSKRKLSTILMANVASPARLVMLTISFKTLFKWFCVFQLYLSFLCLDYHYGIHWVWTWRNKNVAGVGSTTVWQFYVFKAFKLGLLKPKNS